MAVAQTKHVLRALVRLGLDSPAGWSLWTFLAGSALVWSATIIATQRAEDALKSTLDRDLTSVALLMARQVDADAFDTLQTPADESTPAFARIAEALRYATGEGLPYAYVYSMRQTAEGVVFVVDPAPPGDADGDGVWDRAALGELYPDPDPALLEALTGRPTVTPEPFTDKWGTFISGYAPILRADGSVAGIVGLDYRAEDYVARLAVIRETGWGTGIGGTLMSALIAGVVWQMGLRGTRRMAEIRRLSMIAERTGAGVVVADGRRRVTWVNDAYTRITGYALIDLRGRHLLRALQAGGADAGVIELLRDAANECAFRRVELAGRNRAGGEFVVEVELQPLRDDRGRVQGFMAILSDVTARVRAQERIAHQELLLRETGEIAAVGGWELDLTTQTLTWSEQTRRMHEVDDDYVPTVERAIEFYPPEARPRIREAVERAIRDGTSYDLELPFITAAGRERWIRTAGRVEYRTGKPVRLLGAFQDVTEQYRQRQAVQEQAQRLELTVRSANIGTWDWDLPSGRIMFNDVAQTMLGYAPGEWSPHVRQWEQIIHPDDIEIARRAVDDHFEGRTPEYRCEHRLRHKDGRYRWILDVGRVTQRGPDERPIRAMGVHIDITAARTAEEALRTAARTDRLTGLPNRALFTDRLQQAVLRSKRLKDYHFAVLFLDFDRFKTINDSLGHEVGDQLLQEIARRLQQTIRAGDSLSRQARGHTNARLGGDEFVVLLDGLDSPASAVTVADRLIQVFSEPYRLGQHEVYSTASIGIVTSDIGAGSADDVLRDADTAMYEAKLAGKGRYVVFDVSMRQRVQQRLRLETDLRRALDLGQFHLQYQPIVSLQDRVIDSFEVLLRWTHPVRGSISPAEFIPIAEDTGVIASIGEWVLRESCRQFMTWRATMGAHAPPSISVNLSRNQLLLPDLPETIGRIIDETGIPPACLHLEVTESAVMKDTDAAARTLRKLKALGVMLAMDDFGTGYSSLSCLQQFPFDVLKIDRSFIANLSHGRHYAALVQAVVQLARNLNIAVVAEGIETTEQALLLQSLECAYGQGYLFSRPLPPEQVPEYRLAPHALPGAAA